MVAVIRISWGYKLNTTRAGVFHSSFLTLWEWQGCICTRWILDGTFLIHKNSTDHPALRILEDLLAMVIGYANYALLLQRHLPMTNQWHEKPRAMKEIPQSHPIIVGWLVHIPFASCNNPLSSPINTHLSSPNFTRE